MVELSSSPKRIHRLRCALRSVVLPIIREIGYNLSQSRRATIVDVIILILCAITFYLNNLILIPHLLTDGSGDIFVYILKCHLNDFLGGLSFLAYANLLISLVKPEVRFKKLVSILVFIFLCGLFWEYVAPVFVANSVSDYFDLIAYLVGGFVYWLVSKAITKQTMKEQK